MRLKNVPGAQEVIDTSGFVQHDPEACFGRWHDVFGNDHPIELEIGIGKGRYLMDLAERHPENNYLGMEMYSSVLVRAVQKAEQRVSGDELPLPISKKDRPTRPEGCNFRLIRYDATGVTDLFARGEISKIHLNFSDPWPKDRHADRRLTSARFLRRYEAILPSGGGLAFKTDNRSLFDFSLEQLRECGWDILFHTFDLHGDSTDEPDFGTADISAHRVRKELVIRENILTEYEERFVREGKPICMLRATAPTFAG